MNYPDLSSECEIKTSRSGGKGGQNVNKVETRVEVRFNIPRSNLLSADQKEKLLHALQHRMNKEQELIVTSSEARTQLENKARAIRKMQHLIAEGLKEKKKRVKTKIPKAVIQKRLDVKKHHSELKNLRRKISF